jgi:hypothetical protein
MQVKLNVVVAAGAVLFTGATVAQDMVIKIGPSSGAVVHERSEIGTRMAIEGSPGMLMFSPNSEQVGQSLTNIRAGKYRLTVVGKDIAPPGYLPDEPPKPLPGWFDPRIASRIGGVASASSPRATWRIDWSPPMPLVIQ